MNEKERSRHRRFCQFKKEIRHSSEYLIVGIDVAKIRHHAFFGTATGQTLLRRLVFENNRDGFNRLSERTGQLMLQHGLKRAVFGIEPTGNYHKPLASWLLKRDEMLVLVSNKAIADNRQTLDGRWDKNDTKDSANVADLLSQGKCQFFEQPDENLVELRTLLALRMRLAKEDHRLRMQIRNGLVAKHFPEFDAFFGLCLNESLAIVRWCLDPRTIAAMTFEDFIRRVASRNRGLKQKRRLRSIHEIAAKSIGCPMGNAARFEARLLVQRSRRKREQLDEVMKRIEKACKHFPAYSNLLTIPGFGPFVSALVLATIGDPMRFVSRKQLLRLAGLDLNASRSGKRSEQAVPVLSKRGNSYLRYALFQAAMIASYHNDHLRTLFCRYLQDRTKERGIKTKMRVKLAAKLLVIAWAMMRYGTAFNPELIEV